MIVKDAFRFLMPLLAVVIASFWLGWPVAGLFLLLLTAFVAFFFRNPKRDVPADPRVIVSPADGRVVKVERAGNVTKLSIFLSIFDVHVNRSPMRGHVDAIDYRRGKFKAAFNHAASIENERNIIMISQGPVKLVFTQIAGLIARRIVCWKKVGDFVDKGELVGLIRFGSRVDVILPAGIEATVAKGARVRAGATAIGMIKEL
ncbi:MAG: phosphatidylserine decarboxylase family protein [Acidobacteria bacterium]|nr:MAG: phosphatidylserine decarboxylase family protein [Acidobacteriota bacterium]